MEALSFPSPTQPIHVNSEDTKLPYFDGKLSRMYIEEQKPGFFKGLKTFKILKAIDPTFFYVQIVPEPSEPLAKKIKDMDAKMQQYYMDECNRSRMKIPNVDGLGLVAQDRVYAWLNPDRKKWERVRAVWVSRDYWDCTIYGLDTGALVQVSSMDLLELSYEFAVLPSLAYQAYLVDVGPLELDNTGQDWSDYSATRFQKLVNDKKYTGILAVEQERPVNRESIPNHEIILGLILIDDKEPNRRTLNARLVQKGIARSTGISGCSTATFSYFPNETSFRNCWFRAYDEGWFHDPNMFSNPPHIRIPEPLDFFEDGVDQWKMMASSCFEQQDKALAKPDKAHLLPEEISKTLGKYHITHYETPAKMYGIPMALVEEMYRFNEMMGWLFNNDRMNRDVDLKEGNYVIADLPHPPHGRPPHHRATVLKILRNKMAKVFLIDFGTELNMEISRLRPLPEFVTKFPSYARRFHVDGSTAKFALSPTITTSARSKSWSEESTQAVSSFIAYDPSELIYPPTPIVFQSNPTVDRYVELETMESEVVYETESFNNWVGTPYPGGDGYNSSYKVPSKPNRMEAPLHRSYGVDFAFEVPSRDMQLNYKFVKLSDFMVEKMFAVKEFGVERRKPNKKVRVPTPITMEWPLEGSAITPDLLIDVEKVAHSLALLSFYSS